MHKKAHGFTIVELLIVIIVVGVLATISVVAYTSMQNKANDVAVRSDVVNMAKKIELDKVERGHYILGGGTMTTGSSTNFPGFTFQPSKSAYNITDNSNLYYCTGIIDSQRVFRIEARSKSGKKFRYESEHGLKDAGLAAVSREATCDGLTDFSFSYGYYAVTGAWWAWTN